MPPPFTTPTKVVQYESTLQWVGAVHCPACNHNTPAWRSSGMSDCFPHFFCDSCSNVLHRDADKAIVYQLGTTQAALDAITPTLPQCPCGGGFRPGANPKCAHCMSEFPNKANSVTRLADPHMIVLHNACAFSDTLPAYRVEILPPRP